jgi:hypothetical protein
MPKYLLLGKREPVEADVELPNPKQTRLANRAIPPDTTGTRDEPKGAFGGSGYAHRVFTECAGERRVVFADGKDVPRVSLLELCFFSPHKCSVPAVAVGVVEKNDVLLDHLGGNRLILGTDLKLADVVVRRRVRSCEVYGFLPFTVLFDIDATQNVDASTVLCSQRGEFGDARVAHGDVFHSHVFCELQLTHGIETSRHQRRAWFISVV